MNTETIDLSKYESMLSRINPIRVNGKVSEIVGLMVEGHGPAAAIGDVCGIVPVTGDLPVEAEVVGFRKGRVLLMPRFNGKNGMCADRDDRGAQRLVRRDLGGDFSLGADYKRARHDRQA